MTKLRFITAIIVLGIMPIGCNDEAKESSKGTQSYSSELVIKWLNMQAKMLRVPLPAGVGSQPADRAQAYGGITLYESVIPGMQTHHSLQGQLKDFPAMPEVEQDVLYHWAVCGNAALAEINRLLFPAASAANKSSLDSLETAIFTGYQSDVNEEVLQRSVDFGKAVAAAVFEWAKGDGSANSNPAYVPSGAAGTGSARLPTFHLL